MTSMVLFLSPMLLGACGDLPDPPPLDTETTTDTGTVPDHDADDDGFDAEASGGEDCDDEDPEVNPDATETWYDDVDADCDGLSDHDADRDGYDAEASGGEDCDDEDPAVNPDATETWYDGVDADCADDSDDDADGDGHDVVDDCDDADPAVYPGAAETWYDGVDSDCAEDDDYDADGDGHVAEAHDGDDCDDADPEVFESCESTGSPLEDYVSADLAQEILEISSNLSGITWNSLTETYLIVRDSNRRVHELDRDLTHLREIELLGVDHSDIEDISWLGTGDGGTTYALVTEDGVLYIGEIPDDGATEVDFDDFQLVTYAAEPENRNKGGEGVAYDPVTETFWVCIEKDPMTVYTFSRPAAGVDVSYETDLVVTEAFDAETLLGPYITDISSCLYDDRTGGLLVLSHESEVVLDVALDGTVVDSLTVEIGVGGGSGKAEGITLNDDEHLVVAGEPNEYRIYVPSGS